VIATTDSDELEDIRRNVRMIMKRFDPDYFRKMDSERTFPTELFEAMGEAGLFGTLIPARWGGVDAGPAAASVIVEEINRAGGDSAAVNAQMAICTTLARDGSDELRDKWLPQVASGEVRFLTVAATEPDSGADMRDLDSTARRDGDDWILEAAKVFISMAEHTRLMILLVQTAEGPTIFLLDLAEVGSEVEIRPVEMIAHRMTTMLFIDGLRVPDSCRIGPVGGGLRCLMKGFAPRRILAAAESIGNARFLLDISLEHAKTRVTFDRPIGKNQGVQYPLVDAYAKTEAADLMRWDALRVLESGAEAGGRSALAKILASEAAWDVARAAMTTFGGWALASEYHVERKLRECTVFVFNNLLSSYVAHHVLELPRAF